MSFTNFFQQLARDFNVENKYYNKTYMRIETLSSEEEEVYVMGIPEEEKHERLSKAHDQQPSSESVCWTEIPSKTLWHTIFDSKVEEMGDPTDESYMVRSSLVAAVLKEFTVRLSADNKLTLLTIPTAHQAKLFREIVLQYEFTNHHHHQTVFTQQFSSSNVTLSKKVSGSDKHLLARVKTDLLTRMNVWKRQIRRRKYLYSSSKINRTRMK